MVECTACHSSMPDTITGGPHGMHPIGSSWVTGHHDAIPGDTDYEQCAVCHGTDYRGTELSRAQTGRNITVNRDGTIIEFPMYKGAVIGCYNCHNGPTQSRANTSPLPVAASFTTNTLNSQSLTLTLPVSGAGAIARVISQPAQGAVGVSNNMAT